MQLVHALEFGGAERLAATISASLPRDRFSASVCGLFGGEGPLAAELRRRNVPHFYQEAEKKGKPSLFADLFRLFRRERVDIVQVHGAYGLMHGIVPATLAGVKVVYTEHAKQSILRVRSIGLAARHLPRCVAKTVCVSEDLRVFFRDTLGVADKRLRVVYNGIDADRFRADREPFTAGSGEVVIGCVARLTEAKDHDNLLTAFAAARRAHANLRLMIVGDGELRSAVEKRIAALGIAGHVDMLGGRDDVPQLLARMDVFVLSSKREGFPVAILEAMAAGRPVVATDVGGVTEVVSSGSDGIVVPPEDAGALADALVGLVNDPAAARRMGQRGMERVRSSFDARVVIRQYADLFTSVVGNRIGPA